MTENFFKLISNIKLELQVFINAIQHNCTWQTIFKLQKMKNKEKNFEETRLGTKPTLSIKE
jgi:hypothetical protein